MAMIKLKTHETGYAELYFEYVVDIPDADIDQFIDDLEENPINVIQRYPHKSLNDYSELIQHMDVDDASCVGKSFIDSQEEFESEKIIPYPIYADDYQLILHHLHSSFENDSAKIFNDTIKMLKKKIRLFRKFPD